ncbi:MAG: acyl-CoA dehydrogenase family protein [Gemmatimonadota bacterium]
MLTAEQLEIRALAREFAAGEIRPHAAEWDARRALDDGIFDKLAELGFLGMLVPERYGGLGLDVPTYLLALEALAWGDASVALGVAIQNGPVAGILLKHGTEAQKESWLPRMASGEVLMAFALSEAEAGSDAGGLQTVATRDGDGWRITGTKRWVTNGDRAGAALVFARTGTGDDDGIGAFLVERGREGYEVGRRETTLGLSASETVEVKLDQVRVAADALVGEPGGGLGHALEALVLGRTGIAAQAIGIAQAALEHATRYGVEREQFGRAIADFGAIQFKLADMAARIAGARALTLEVGRELEQEREEGADGAGRNAHGAAPLAARAAMAKLLASEAAMWVTNQAVQIYGGYGYMRDYPVEKLMRDAKGTEIYEGTSEILRLVIAREVVGAERAGNG